MCGGVGGTRKAHVRRLGRSCHSATLVQHVFIVTFPESNSASLCNNSI
jgi:hypothetical protein